MTVVTYVGFISLGLVVVYHAVMCYSTARGLNELHDDPWWWLAAELLVLIAAFLGLIALLSVMAQRTCT